MRVVIKKVGQFPEVREIEGTLENLAEKEKMKEILAFL